jgi:hypothetical protein
MHAVVCGEQCRGISERRVLDNAHL